MEDIPDGNHDDTDNMLSGSGGNFGGQNNPNPN
jgi:hypothetical protein